MPLMSRSANLKISGSKPDRTQSPKTLPTSLADDRTKGNETKNINNSDFGIFINSFWLRTKQQDSK